eukprot:365157-Chlamydomonas_euryale.AAC.12
MEAGSDQKALVMLVARAQVGGQPRRGVALACSLRAVESLKVHEQDVRRVVGQRHGRTIRPRRVARGVGRHLPAAEHYCSIAAHSRGANTLSLLGGGSRGGKGDAPSL